MPSTELTPRKLALLARLLEKQSVDGALLPLQPLVRDDDPLPLSFAQEQLWVVHRLEPDSPAYNVHVALPLDATIDASLVESSLRQIGLRHEVLRTAFPAVDGRPVPRVSATFPLELARVDLSGLAAGEREAAFARAGREAASAPFDLLTGPLLRATLVWTGAPHQVLLLTMHHVVTDGWSMGVLFRELRELIAAAQSGRPADLPALPLQYADYAAWHRALLTDRVLDTLRAYWKLQLAGATPLNLPADRRRPSMPSHTGAVVSELIGIELTDRIKRLGRQAGATLFSTLLSAYVFLLHVCSGERDIVVGVPVANRERAEVQSLIGYFVNMVAVRTLVERQWTVSDLIARVHATAAEGFAHQQLPFDRLVAELGLERDPSRSPVFQTVFNLLNEQQTTSAAGVSSGDGMSGAVQTTRFDLEGHVVELREGLRVNFIYSTDLFDAASGRRLFQLYVRVLEAMVRAPETRLDGLSITSEQEQAQTLVAWNPAGPVYPRDASLASLFEAQVALRRSSVALECGPIRLTYLELNRRANQVARALRRAGVRTDTPVGVLLPRGIDLIVTLVGILKAGGAYVALNPDDPESRLGLLLAEASVAFVVAAPGAASDALRGLTTIDVESVGEDASDLELEIPADALAYIAFTSGSTGRPKGVAVVQRAVSRLVFGADYITLGPDETLLQLAPVSFDASTLEIWGALLRGGRLVIYPERVIDPQELGVLLRQSGVTTLWLTSSLYNTVIDQAPEALVGVRQLIAGGEALSVPHVRRGLAQLPTTTIVNGYGPTENTTFSCCYRIPRTLPGDAVSIPLGGPIAHTSAYVLDPAGEPVPVGVPGELHVGGDGLARGYVGAPRQTAERFVPDGVSGASGARLYRTGDQVRWRQDGTLEYLGRRDGQVKLRGFRIELGEIEAALTGLAGVAAAVAAVQDTADGKRLVAHVVPAADAVLEGADLRAALQRIFPAYMVPAAVAVLPVLPLNANGKVDRRALPDAFARQSLTPDSASAPRTDVEATLARIWRDVLRLSSIGIHDNFFELGGDSILGIQIVARAFDVGLQLKARHLFQYPTIADLALVAVQADRKEKGTSGAVSGPAPLTPIQRWFLDDEQDEAHHFNQAVMLRLNPGADFEAMAAAIAWLAARHEMLRARFRQTVDGWQQEIAPSAERLTRVDLSASIEGPAALQELCASVQRGLTLDRGPVFRAVWIDLPEDAGSRLLLVAHHLAVDGVSWRIICSDVERAYVRLARAESPEADDPPTPFSAWARTLSAEASQISAEEIAYWTAEAAAAAQAATKATEAARELPLLAGDARRVGSTLPASETAALLRDVPRAFDAPITDVLLAALACAVGRQDGQARLRVDLERHGRSDRFEGVDVSRTVGWFTTIHPVTLEIAGRATLDAIVAHVRASMERVPRDGIGYGVLRYLGPVEVREQLAAAGDPAISVNYLGQFDQLAGESSVFSLAVEAAGPLQSPRIRRRHQLDLVAFVYRGELRTEWTFDPRCHTEDVVERLSAGFIDALKELGAAATLRTTTRPRAAERSYPLSPLQHGMLFHTLMHPDDGVYSELFACRLEGRLDVDAFRAAWDRVIARHDILRSVFAWEGVPDPVQIVRDDVEVPWTVLDWTGVDSVQQRERLTQLMAGEERGPFDLAHGPLMRMVLVRLNGQEAQFVWTFHHILLDGWSMAVVFRELFAAYEALLDGREAALGPATQFGSYVRWLRQQDAGAGRDYWRHTLAGVRGATPLGIDRPAASIAGSSDSRECLTHVSEALTASVVAAARRCKVTVNAMLLGAWATLLSRYSGRDDVVFGTTVSGRPATLAGAESMVGLLINTVPVRVTVPKHLPVAAWLDEIQTAQAQQREHEHVPLVEIARATGLPQGEPLFESIVVFENYPVEQIAVGARRALVARQAQSRHRSNFPLVLAASPGRRLALQVIYDSARIEDDAARELLSHLQTVLAQMAEDPERLVSRLSLLAAPEQEELLSRCHALDGKVAAARTLAGEPFAGVLRLAGSLEHGLRAYVVDRDLALAPPGVTGELYLEERGVDTSDVTSARLAAVRLVPDPFGPLPGARLYRSGATAMRRWNGEIHRRAMAEGRQHPDRASSRSTAVDDGVLPRTHIEARIADIWCEVLGVRTVGVRDHFFDLGGHSLLATKAVARLRHEFQRKFPLVMLFESPVLQDLAAAIERFTTAEDPLSAGRLAVAPLSSAQQRLWFLDQLDPGSAAYNVPGAVHIAGALDVSALDRAFTSIICRHEILRTTFGTGDGQPVQIIGPCREFRFDRVDLRHVPDHDDRRERARHLANVEALAPFELATGPLVRGRLLQLDEHEFVLVLTLHHIVCDAWSLQLLVRELMALYEAHAAGSVPDLPALALQYSDFAVWQQSWLDGASGDRQLQYWRDQLRNGPTLELPSDRPRAARQSFDGACHTRRLPRHLAAALRQIGQDQQATMFMTLLAAFELLLARYTGQHDLVVGTPVAVRPRQEFEPLIGFFSNTLALRTRIARRETFGALVGRVRATVLEAFANQDLPFDRVVDAVQPERHLDRHPLFQVLFTMQHAPEAPLRLPGLRLQPFEIERLQVRFDLELHVAETEDGLLTAFYYSEALFDRETIAQMAEAFATLLESIAAAPRSSIDELVLLPRETADVHRRWNATAREIPRGPALQQMVEAQVRRTPDAVAVDFHGVQLTYAQLNARANQLARVLRGRGVRPDDCVAIGVERGLLLPIAVLGAMKAGGAYMPLDAAYPEARLRYMLANSGARVLVTQSTVGMSLIASDDAAATLSVLQLDRDAETIDAEPQGDLPCVNDPDHLAYVLYTSGSTGRPKGVAMPHQPLLNLLLWQLDVSKERAAGRTLQYAPLSFDPSFLEMFSTWSAGGTLVLIEEELRRDFIALAHLIERQQIERLYITPGALHQLADAAESCGLACRSLREVNAAGERLEVTPPIARLLGQIDGGVLFNQYGPTESHVVTVETLPAPADRWPTLPTIGVALPNTRIHVIDRAGHEAPIGVPGELHIAGDCLARGYLDNPRLTAERFVPDPFDPGSGGRLYRTGDLARFRRDGLVEYLGRTDHQVKLRGYRVELAEVEAILTQHPDVQDAAATVWQSPGGSPRLVAYVVSRGAGLRLDELRQHAARLLPEFMVPSIVELIDALPQTPSGKVDRSALPAPAIDSASEPVFVAPRNDVELKIAAIWSECLGAGRVGIHDNFFAVGGHSLLAAQMVSRVRREWGFELPIRTIFESPTIAGLSERLQTLMWAAQVQVAGGGQPQGDREEGQL